MIYLILGMVVLFAVPTFLKRKYNNPFKLIFIFGKKGAGKSTYMVMQMIKHQKKGWTIYTDMKSCTIPGVRIIDVKDLTHMVAPPRSCLFLEEAGLTFNNRKFKDFNDGYTELMKYLRQYKLKMYMNSQAFDVDKKIRDTTDSMLLVTSVLDCISVIRPICRTITLTEPSADAESRIADKLFFAKPWNWKFMWMPRYHKYFKSFNPPPRPEIPFLEVTTYTDRIPDNTETETPLIGEENGPTEEIVSMSEYTDLLPK